MRRLIPAILVFALVSLAGCASRGGGAGHPRATEPQPVAAVGAIESIDFLGGHYLLKWKATEQVIPVYEFYRASESPEDWDQLTAIRTYPANLGRPIDHATRTAAHFKKHYPLMHFALYEDDNSDAALLDFLVPSPDYTYFEFNAFRFFVGKDGRVIGFQYAQKVPIKGGHDAAVARIRALRAKVIQAMVKFRLPTNRSKSKDVAGGE